MGALESPQHTCPYCDQPLRLQDMTIDHIVPEALADDPEKFAAFRLAPNFPMSSKSTTTATAARSPQLPIR